MDDLRRNAEFYSDPTAYKAISKVMKGEKSMIVNKGEIYAYETTNGFRREILVLSAHTDVSTVLMLSDNSELPVPVNSRTMMYTNPAMIQYVFNDRLNEYIKTVPDDEFHMIMNAVIDSLGIVPAKTEAVDHPAHYQGKNECIDVMIAMFGVEAVKAFCKCNAYKYRFRSDKKNGQEDVNKAEWYETKLIQLEREGVNYV